MKSLRFTLLFSLSVAFLDAEETESDTLMQSEIKHMVVLMLENRSFDNVLGWLYDKNDASITYIPPTTNQPFQGLSEDMLAQYTNVLTDSNGNVVFTSPPIKGVPSVSDGPYLSSPSYDPHEGIANVTSQIYGSTDTPNMTGFLQDYASEWSEDDWVDQQKMIKACLETYTENELPIFYGLAKHYAVSDDWFSSVPTQTNPNRAFAACGTSEGQTVNGWYFNKSTFHCDTIWNRLSDLAPQATWKIFWQASMFPIVVPGPFSGPNSFKNMLNIPNLDSHYDKIDSFHELARLGTLPAFSFIEPQFSYLADLAPRLKGIDEVFIPPFFIGWQGNDMHPPTDMRTVENQLANIYTSLISNQEAWNQTLLVITFDEHGGIFDHISPPPAVPPDNNNQNGFSFDRFGVRVPTIFISPKVQKSSVVRSNVPNVPFDHASLNATVLSWLNIEKSQWNLGNRCAIAPTFDTVITTNTARTDAVIAPSDVVLPAVDPANVVHIGDRFYLRDQEGNYITENAFCFDKVARAGAPESRVALTFAGGQGDMTHGSFALIQSLDSGLGSNNILSVSVTAWDCSFAENNHSSDQWWTIKSMDTPYLGAPIQYGDRLYLENNTYMDIAQFVPARLVKEGGLFGSRLVTKGIIEPGSESRYWIIEKAE